MKLGFVLDASLALAIVLNEESEYARRIFRDLFAESVICVPLLWHLEMRNILILQERSGKLPPGIYEKALEGFRCFSLFTDTSLEQRNSLDALDVLLHEHKNLTSYDASYIELALRLNLPVATLDREMMQVARELGCLLE